MKQLHHEIRSGVKQLERGEPPNPRRPEYVRNDRNIDLAKESLQDWLDNVHEVGLHDTPANVSVVEHELATLNNLRERLLRHLDRVQYCIG